ncbi:MAG: lipoprotein signal peptidase [Bacteroidia bacterium]|nr:lipoprotein signal peptidase [Bacteroidia bacterium]
MRRMKKSLIIILLVLLVDQAIKFYIKTHFFLGEEYHVAGNWFILHFTENNGMAFGMEFAGNYGKIFLSAFRIVAVVGIAWYLYDLIKLQSPSGLVISISLILGGALGNIIDSVFYGQLFSDSSYEIAKFLPAEGGYAGWLHGRVVDMFYFPIITGHFPAWFPIWATEEFIFFRPVFNFSDSAITVGVAMILLFQRNFFPKKSVDGDSSNNNSNTEANLSE